MIELKTRAEQFLRSIQAEGERQCAAIRAKTDAEVTESLSAARREEAQESTPSYDLDKIKWMMTNGPMGNQ